MNHESARDYLGHPCKFTEAKDHFSEPFDNAQKREFRDIKRDVGKGLMALQSRMSHALYASHAICDQVQSVDHTDQLHSLLELLAEYELKTCNDFYTFAGSVLAGFEYDTKTTIERG
jgi:hypothetical protein